MQLSCPFHRSNFGISEPVTIYTSNILNYKHALISYTRSKRIAIQEFLHILSENPWNYILSIIKRHVDLSTIKQNSLPLEIIKRLNFMHFQVQKSNWIWNLIKLWNKWICKRQKFNTRNNEQLYVHYFPYIFLFFQWHSSETTYLIL